MLDALRACCSVLLLVLRLLKYINASGGRSGAPVVFVLVHLLEDAPTRRSWSACRPDDRGVDGLGDTWSGAPDPEDT